MKFPQRLRFKNRGDVLATIFKINNPNQPFKVYWRSGEKGKRRSLFKAFASYRTAKKFADEKVAEIADNRPSRDLSPGQVTDAIIAFKKLDEHYRSTGRRISLATGIAQFCAADAKGGGRLLTDMVDGFMANTASVKRRDIKVAVEEFIALDEPKTKSENGERPALGKGYLSQKKGHLVKFANLFPNHAVCDLTKGSVDLFFKELPKLPQRMKGALKPNSAKSRNHHRGSLKQFFAWAVRNDLLPANHRLLEAESMRAENTNGGETHFYTPKEFRTLLEGADERLQPLIAIGGLAGLRTAELLRLTWEDVWRVPRHVEVTAGKSKTRQRRLVEVVPALAAWLNPYRQHKTGKLWLLDESKFQDHFLALCQDLKMKRKPNGLRHSFGSFHFALHANENLTAQQMGNSPSMVHQHYKGLATKREAKAWFNTKPAKQANVIPLKAEESA